MLDKQKPGKREESKQYRYPVSSSQSPDDAGWESEVYAREEELGAHEGRILAREFKQRLAYNIGQASQRSRTALLHSPLYLSCFTCTGLHVLINWAREEGLLGNVRAILEKGIHALCRLGRASVRPAAGCIRQRGQLRDGA